MIQYRSHNFTFIFKTTFLKIYVRSFHVTVSSLLNYEKGFNYLLSHCLKSVHVNFFLNKTKLSKFRLLQHYLEASHTFRLFKPQLRSQPVKFEDFFQFSLRFLSFQKIITMAIYIFLMF